VKTFYRLKHLEKTFPSGRRPVLPLHRGTGVHQQLYQPFHLRRQVPRVPERRQTSDGKDEADSAEPVSSHIHQVKRGGRLQVFLMLWYIDSVLTCTKLIYDTTMHLYHCCRISMTV